MPEKAVSRLKFVNSKSIRQYIDEENLLEIMGGLDNKEFEFAPEVRKKMMNGSAEMVNGYENEHTTNGHENGEKSNEHENGEHLNGLTNGHGVHKKNHKKHHHRHHHHHSTKKVSSIPDKPGAIFVGSIF